MTALNLAEFNPTATEVTVMKTKRHSLYNLIWAFGFMLFCSAQGIAQDDPLPSWNDGDVKNKIIDFVIQATDEESVNYIPGPQRIATFDNDGTLWAEQPLYFQLLYALDTVSEMAESHPQWRDDEPFKSVLANDMQALMATGMAGLAKVLAASHANQTAEQFKTSVNKWLANTKHPETGMRYTEMVYQPMLELLEFLRANGFKTYIVSGGGIDFVRVFSERVYGIPPEQVVGTTIDAEYSLRYGIPTIVKKPKLVLLDDKAGKPVGIYQHIGRRPVFAAGNSDGDFEMLEYTTVSRSPDDTRMKLGLIVHHTDAEREWAYDRDSHIGRLVKGLDQAEQQGWVVIDMKTHWNRIYPRSE